MLSVSVSVYLSIFVSFFFCLYLSLSVSPSLALSICIYFCMYVCMYVRSCLCVCVCACVCVCICVYNLCLEDLQPSYSPCDICFSVSPTTSPAMSTIPPRRVVITENADHTTTGGKEHVSPETIRWFVFRC